MRRIERWIFAPGTAERLASLRIGLCAVLTWRLMRGVFLELAGQPASLFEPRSFMNVLGSQPPRGIVLAIQVAGVAAGVAATAGLFARLTLPVAWTCAVFLNGMVTSNGKIMHNDVLLILCIVPLLIAPVVDVWSVDAWRRRRTSVPAAPSSRYGWPVRTAMIVVAGAYFFTGLSKVMHSGPAWFTSSNLRWVMYASSDSQGSANPFALFVADRAWLAHILALATIALELTFPIVLFRSRPAAPYAVAAAGLHAGIWLTMRLDYSAMAATALIVLVDWPAILARVKDRFGSGSFAPAARLNE
jgi:vitamin K-dependent gamma-carboxylase-like protein